MNRFKTAAVIFIAAAAIGLTACGKEPFDGEDLVEAARDAYESYDSARVLITNEDTGEVEQEFVFKYDEKDSCTYLYTGGYEGTGYIQYNNGFECFTEQDGEYTYLERGDTDFEAYTRDSKHPQASGAYLPYERSAIESVEKSEDSDGNTVYTYSYDPDSFDTDASIASFDAVYHFDDDGELAYFEEISVLSEDGEDVKHSYRIDITDINSVDEIENPLVDKADEE